MNDELNGQYEIGRKPILATFLETRKTFDSILFIN